MCNFLSQLNLFTYLLYIRGENGILIAEKSLDKSVLFMQGENPKSIINGTLLKFERNNHI